jgi:hypothetical protein
MHARVGSLRLSEEGAALHVHQQVVALSFEAAAGTGAWRRVGSEGQMVVRGTCGAKPEAAQTRQRG